LLLSATTRDETHEEIPDGFRAEDLIKTTLSKKPIRKKDEVQMEFILRCAAAVGRKWNKVRTENGKKRKQACDEAATLSDMAFAACAVKTCGVQWTANESNTKSDSATMDVNEEAESQEFVDKCRELKQQLEGLEQTCKGKEALGKWMDKREKERKVKMSSVNIDEDSDKEEQMLIKKMASEHSIAVWNKIESARFKFNNTLGK